MSFLQYDSILHYGLFSVQSRSWRSISSRISRLPASSSFSKNAGYSLCLLYTSVLNCPASAWTRDEKKYYRLTLLGRTGKRNPRLGEDFIKWVDEDSIIKIILNTYKYVEHYIDRSAPGGKEHIGYIVDRTGFEEFKKWALEDVYKRQG